MRRLRCQSCGLSYSSATLPAQLLSSSGAACPRCGSPLSDDPAVPDPARRPRFGSTPDRHRAAIGRTVAWAEDAARRADYAAALSWLATIEAVEGELTEGLQARRRAWAHRMRIGGAGRAEH